MSVADTALGSQVRLTTLSLVPLIFTVDPLLTVVEADSIIALAEPQLEDSKVGSMAAASTERRASRTSSQTRLPNDGGELVTVRTV